MKPHMHVNFHLISTVPVKYIPQVYLNYHRKSTVGWNITNVLLDFTGGALSVFQLCVDSYLNNDWTEIAGDPVKFGLGSASMFFDIIFMIQHYCLYPRRSKHGGPFMLGIQDTEDSEDDGTSPLIDEEAHAYHKISAGNALDSKA